MSKSKLQIPSDAKQKAIRRLNIIAGQVRGLSRMVAQNEYCVDIIRQSLAVKKALSSFEDLLLERHLATHAAEQMKSGRTKKAVGEIVSIYRLAKQK